MADSVDAFRAYQETLGRRMEPLGRHVLLRDGAYEPPEPAEGGTVLYFHGGGYVSGDGAYMRSVASLLARRLCRRVLCVDYRLAPCWPWPAAVEDGVEAALALWADGCQPEDTVFLGDSSGGGLALAVCQALQKQGLPLPAGWIALSPWADLTTCAGRTGRDSFCAWEDLDQWAALYAGAHDRQTVSPLYGPLAGLPPALLLAGKEELLLPDIRRLWEALRAAGTDAALLTAPGCGHCYPLAGGRYSRKAFDAMVEFLRRTLPAARAR